jgi:hypothetical protein
MAMELASSSTTYLRQQSPHLSKHYFLRLTRWLFRFLPALNLWHLLLHVHLVIAERFPILGIFLATKTSHLLLVPQRSHLPTWYPICTLPEPSRFLPPLPELQDSHQTVGGLEG